MSILSAEKNGGTRYFDNLNGLRTLAFLIVFLQHTFSEWIYGVNVQNGWGGKILRLIFQSGDLGVSAFFVLSGFLITHLLLNEKRDTRQINIPNFYMRRLLRIWPLYLAVLLYGFCLYPLIKEAMGLTVTSKNNFLYYFSFLSNFDVISNERTLTNDPQISVTWSIAVEEQFYLIWPLLFTFLSKAYLKWMFVAIIIGCEIFRMINRNDMIVLYFHSLSVIADLALGGLAAYYAFYSDRFITIVTQLSKNLVAAAYLTGLIWLVFGESILPVAAFHTLSRLINTVFFIFIILEQCYCRQSFFKFSRLSFLSSWGKYTFGLYLLHPIVLRVVEMSVRKIFNLQADVLHANFGYTVFQAAITLAITMGVSYVSYEYFEKFFLGFKSRFSHS
jgi:peptidoglycan/LPS O-acetylase OafA/YrhL